MKPFDLECVVIRDPEFLYMLIEKISLVPKQIKRKTRCQSQNTQESVTVPIQKRESYLVFLGVLLSPKEALSFETNLVGSLLLYDYSLV